jgi:hypothetical protein
MYSEAVVHQRQILIAVTRLAIASNSYILSYFSTSGPIDGLPTGQKKPLCLQLRLEEIPMSNQQ